MNLDIKAKEAEITQTITVAVQMATCGVQQMTVKKYAEMTGMNRERVLDWCNIGVLTAEKINLKGERDNSAGLWIIDYIPPPCYNRNCFD